MNRFQKLLPREDKFFDLFETHAAVLVEGASRPSTAPASAARCNVAQGVAVAWGPTLPEAAAVAALS